jgi:hypothetical protein
MALPPSRERRAKMKGFIGPGSLRSRAHVNATSRSQSSCGSYALDGRAPVRAFFAARTWFFTSSALCLAVSAFDLASL